MELITNANIWVKGSKLSEVMGLTEDAIDNYRKRVWQQGKHWVKISPSGQATQKGVPMYHIPRINKWIEAHPQL